MLAVDSNVLVRFLARDDPDQSPKAVSLLGSREHQPIYIGLIVLVEAYWILAQVKKFPASQVRSTIRELIAGTGVEFENPRLVEQALDAAEAANCDFADALIALSHVAAGCDQTATFDRRAQRLAAMTAVEDIL